MTQKRRITLRDVAQAAQVSEMTVSRVLLGREGVSLRTQQKVQKVVNDLGYVQNRLAGSLVENRSNQIAVIIPSLTNNVFTEVMSGITQELERAGYNAVVGITDYDLDREEALVISMMSWRPAAIILSNTTHTERTRRILENTTVPVVEMMSLNPDAIDISVGINQRAAARELAEHVISMGHERFGFLGWNQRDKAAVARFSEIESVITSNGLHVQPPHQYNSPPNFLRGKQGMQELIEGGSDLDAIFFSNDTTAIGGMIYCIEREISIPDEIALVGFSGLVVGQNMPLKLTTIETRRLETGKTAARSVLNRLNGRRERRVFDMGYALLKGETV